MMQIIIFSFNRALQLDTLLSSYLEHWKAPKCQIDVIYNTRGDSFQKGYDLLINKLSSYNAIRFHKEECSERGYSFREYMYNLVHILKYPVIRKPKTNFRNMMIKLMEESNAKEVMFMTDDAMFIRDVTIPEQVFKWVKEDPKKRQFSLRLGKGMNNQPLSIKEEGGFLNWDLDKVERNSNWGYRFSVDAHIYDKQLILDYYKKYVFTSPNTLEGYIEAKLYKDKLVTEGRSFIDAKLLSFPVNMVQTFSQNETLGVDAIMMNQYYLDGYTMKYPVPDTIDTFQVYPDHLLFYKGDEVKKIATKQ